MGDAPCFGKKRPGEAMLHAALKTKKAAGLSAGGFLLDKIYNFSAEHRQTGPIKIKPIIKISVCKMVRH
jgi:hypothetical protein